MTGDASARFAREWNAAFLLVALVAVGLLAAGYLVAATIAIGILILAVGARATAMRRQGRRFYGQDKAAS